MARTATALVKATILPERRAIIWLVEGRGRLLTTGLMDAFTGLGLVEVPTVVFVGADEAVPPPPRGSRILCIISHLVGSSPSQPIPRGSSGRSNRHLP
jgi:hypothetical protein